MPENPTEGVGVVAGSRHPLILAGIKCIADFSPRALRLLGLSADLASLRSLVEKEHPRVAVIDTNLHETGSIFDAVAALREQVACVMVHERPDPLMQGRLRKAGALGFVTKIDDLMDLPPVIAAAASGKWSSGASAHPQGTNLPGDNIATSLSDRELDVFFLIGKGVTTKKIAGILGISPKTVETHRKNIGHKLQLPGSYRLQDAAIRYQLGRFE